MEFLQLNEYLLRNIFRFIPSLRAAFALVDKMWNRNFKYINFNKNALKIMKHIKDEEWLEVYNYYEYYGYLNFKFKKKQIYFRDYRWNDGIKLHSYERVNLKGKEQFLFQASKCGKVGIVKLMLDKGVDPSANNQIALKKASENGHLQIVKLLLKDKRVDPSISFNYPLFSAVKYNHYKVVKLLLEDERVDPASYYNCIIIEASRNGYHKIVKLLLEYFSLKFLNVNNLNCEMLFDSYKKMVDPSACNNEAIISASKYGNYKVVKLLLGDKRVNPADRNNEAIRVAYKNKHYKVVELLSEDKRVDVNTIIKNF